MKIRVKQNALESGLSIVSACLGTRTIRPVLQNVKLTARDGVLDLQATDLETSVRHLISAEEGVEIDEDGEVLVPGKQFQSIVSKEKADSALEIASDGSTCTIRGNDSHFDIVAEDPADFPTIPERLEASGDGLPARTFKRMIGLTAFAVDNENPRAALTGVFVMLDKKSVEMVATDGRRMAVVRKELPGSADGRQELIVPCKALREVERAIREDDSTVTVSGETGQNQIVFQTSRTMISSVLVDAQYPNYKEVLPKELTRKVSLKREDLRSAVARAAIVSSDDTRAVELEFSGASLTVRARGAEKGTSEIRVSGVELPGEGLSISFNPDFLLDVLGVLDEKEVDFQFNDSRSAAQLSVEDFVYVIMPIKPAE